MSSSEAHKKMGHPSKAQWALLSMSLFTVMFGLYVAGYIKSNSLCRIACHPGESKRISDKCICLPEGKPAYIQENWQQMRHGSR